MSAPAFATPRLLRRAVVLTMPAAAILALMVMVQGLHVLVAGGLWLCAVAVVALMIRRTLRDAARLSLWARNLAAGGEAPAPDLTPESAAEEIASSVAQLRRAWQDRQGELAALARWNDNLFELLPDALVLLDEERRVVRVNAQALALFGRDLSGRDLAAVLRTPQVLDAADKVLAGGPAEGGSFDLVVPLEQSFRFRIDPLGRSPASTAVAVMTLTDLTAIKRMERMRADFVANASHELRTPLATLLGFIDTLRGPAKDDAEAHERFLAIMHEQGSRMARLIDDLLSLSRIEADEHTVPATVVDLARIVQGGADALAPLAQAKNARILVNLAQESCMVRGQADQLAQVVQNLLDNAVKYGRPGGTVTVTLGPADRVPDQAPAALRSGPAVVLAVEDQGEGIGREHLPRLTERFYRVDGARSRALGGTGLGLAIVKHIVNRHRGHLAIESVEGRGSTFSVTLTLASS
ncbi:ATP-binding protein [Magnetospirillum moscoviense]|uniref:histidine kinase n=1 Tax=Magnetospirillum moscoviense TaxID=1437059 RepID=A0A178MF49_9PROT|nr:ATP-binding protein [Magnetospirillum moscoviense]OAN47156.1 two-component sensor histidine kinase [Magnetospirillum moscoviense]